MKHLTCTDCGDRVCTITTSRAFKEVPETCPWSSVVGHEIVCRWAERKSPADQVKVV